MPRPRAISIRSSREAMREECPRDPCRRRRAAIPEWPPAQTRRTAPWSCRARGRHLERARRRQHRQRIARPALGEQQLDRLRQPDRPGHERGEQKPDHHRLHHPVGRQIHAPGREIARQIGGGRGDFLSQGGGARQQRHSDSSQLIGRRGYPQTRRRTAENFTICTRIQIARSQESSSSHQPRPAFSCWPFEYAPAHATWQARRSHDTRDPSDFDVRIAKCRVEQIFFGVFNSSKKKRGEFRPIFCVASLSKNARRSHAKLTDSRQRRPAHTKSTCLPGTLSKDFGNESVLWIATL